MSIQSGDIKLVASQVMDDVDTGGGAPTSTIIADGASNSVFNDISELDRAGGRVNLRKVFAHVRTPNTDGYYGGNLIISEPTADPRVSVAIFKAQSVFDRRTDAANRIESYLNKGVLWDGYLLENHIQGQRAIQLFARETATPPAVGKTLHLVMNEDGGTEYSQYVRVTKVSSVVRAFSYSTGSGIVDYSAQVITCELSDALLYDFPGSAPSRLYQQESTKTRVRDTLVADASKYYGASPLAAAIDLGDVSATVESIYTRIVPSAQTETPIVDANAAGNISGAIASGNGSYTLTVAAPIAAGQNLYLGLAIIPGSLTIAYAGGELTDSGGELLAGSTVVGSVDYARGTVTMATSAPTYSGAKTVSFSPAAAPIQLADTAVIDVQIENRGYNYVLTIDPVPSPGTLTVSYMVAGTWYDLKDNGTGVLRGADAAFGVGTVSYSTGTVAVTLGALPDVDSSIVYAWGNAVSYFNRADQALTGGRVRLQLPQAGLTPGSVAITWNDGSNKSAHDNTAGGMTGDATGTIDYDTGAVELIMGTLPAAGQTYTVAMSYGPPATESITDPTRSGNDVYITLAQGNITPGSVSMVYTVAVANADAYSVQSAYLNVVPTQQIVASKPATKRVFDDGAGNLKDEAGGAFGTIDYVTGDIVLHPSYTASLPIGTYSTYKQGYFEYRNVFAGWSYVSAYATMPDTGGRVDIRYSVTSGNAGGDTITATALVLDLTPNYAESIVPGAAAFAIGGKSYFDRGGSVYSDFDATTGTGTLAGSINYASGEVQLSSWTAGAANTPVLRSLATTIDGNPVDAVVFRVPVAPVRPGSVQILATTLTGATINVTADASGVFSGAGILGDIDYSTGVVRCRFGAYVTAAGHEDENWYDASAVRTDGTIFKPGHVFASSIKYNAVSYSYLPLDASIIGLNPVRLPQDGRVPIFRSGDFAVIGHTGEVAAQNVTNGQTVDCGRVRLSRIRVLDVNGEVIYTGYSEDLDAGTVTFTDVSGYAQPIVIEHRIEDMVQVSDAQINGRLSFTRQVSHDYPLGSYISSALVAGDMHAYVGVMFDQVTWTNVWSDAVIGSPATATFNDVVAPLVVTNAGAVTERWAIQFTSTTSFNLIGEHVGVIAQGNTASDLAPINPATGSPYFTLPALGWGAGWSAGNVLRFNTTGALFPAWIIRTIQQGPETVTDDSFTLLIRGDVDRT